MTGLKRSFVLHRIDDLENCRPIAKGTARVLHRIDDLEKRTQSKTEHVCVLHRIDDLETGQKWSWPNQCSSSHR